MAQEYITLDQAAQNLSVNKDQFLELADKHKLRRFNGPDTVRFWKHQVEELGRQMGLGSDPELQPRDAGGKPPSSEGIFAFDVSPSDSSSHIFTGGGPKKAGSDSDVRLVPQGSDVELKSGPGNPASSSTGKSGGPASSIGSKVKLDSDSDVKLVEDDSAVPIGREGTGKEDSDARLKSSSSKLMDSGVRLVEDKPGRKKPDSGLVTEELDLDAELRQAEQSAKPPSSKSKMAPFGLAKESPKAKEPTPSSSEFELTPGAPANQPSDSLFDSSSEQIKLDPEDDSSIHVSASRDLGIGDASGVNLHKPSDKGISLEKDPAESSSESITFDLAADEGKKPSSKKKPGAKQPAADVDSSSEFELTLDDAGLAPLDEDKGSKDVFKTDLGTAAAKKAAESSGELSLDSSEEFAETSDFELALDEESSSVEGETGSEVIVIDEDAGEAEATALRPDALGADEEVAEGVEEELAVEEAVEEGVEPSGRRQLVPVEAPPAEWGIWGGVHLLTLIALIPTGFLLFEMVHSIWGYNKETAVTGAMFKFISENLMK
jgi:hypothetical protein